MNKRIGILGGAFDPIHYGHLILASEAKSQLQLDHILFVPTAKTAHKHKDIETPFKHRFKMIEMAIAKHGDFLNTDLENHRDGLSYTVDTLQKLKVKYNDAELFLIVGSDNLESFNDWHDPDGILKLAVLAVANRAGYKLEKEIAGSNRVDFEMPLIDISASEIRNRIVTGKQVRFLLPPEVEEYIKLQGLYLEQQ